MCLGRGIWGWRSNTKFDEKIIGVEIFLIFFLVSVLCEIEKENGEEENKVTCGYGFCLRLPLFCAQFLMNDVLYMVYIYINTGI